MSYEYDDQGRLSRAVIERDPEWLEVDRGESLALLAEDALKCGGCGHPVDESMSPENEGSYTTRRMQCHACLVGEFAAEQGAGDDRGIRIAVVKKPSTTST